MWQMHLKACYGLLQKLTGAVYLPPKVTGLNPIRDLKYFKFSTVLFVQWGNDAVGYRFDSHVGFKKLFIDIIYFM